MSSSIFIRRGLFPITAGAMTMAISFTPSSVIAEELPRKKSIYDPLPSEVPPPSHTKSEPTQPTPTERLSGHVRTARLFINAHYAIAEERFNEYLSRYLSLEHNVTSTIAALAPSKESGEQVVPGLIYLSVAAMSGSILVRKRMWPVRFITPLLVATGASWYFLPETTRNVGNLMWHFEKKVPVIADTHLTIRKTAEDNWEFVRKNTLEARNFIDENVHKTRATVEEWVKKQ